jgi:hypothetical protein
MGLSTDALAGRVEVVVSAGSAAWPEPEFFSGRQRVGGFAAVARAGRRPHPGVSGRQPDRRRKKNFGTARGFKQSCSGLQLKFKYWIVVIVNGGALLWISLVLSTRSAVYVPYKPVGRACMFLVEKMDKNRRRVKSRGSAQSVPVDMQTVIHSTETITIW